jgi:DNA-binding NtrC family response regulator
MTLPRRVLMVGQETILLETRSRILELAGYEVSPVLEISVAERALSCEPYDLSILCHTLRPEHRSSILTCARLRQPTIKTLILVDDQPVDFPLAANEAIFSVFNGPRALLATVDDLLGCSQNDPAISAASA